MKYIYGWGLWLRVLVWFEGRSLIASLDTCYPPIGEGRTRKVTSQSAFF